MFCCSRRRSAPGAPRRLITVTTAHVLVLAIRVLRTSTYDQTRGIRYNSVIEMLL